MHSINILFPVYNEENRLEQGIRRTKEYISKTLRDVDIAMTIVDNASTDKTEEIALSLAAEIPELSYIRIQEKGVGAAFRAGVAKSAADIVGYMDIDLSTDLRALYVMKRVFEDRPEVMMVNASKQAKGSKTIGRSALRNLTSKGLTMVMKAGLGMKATDAICGFKFFRREFVQELIRQADTSENGWFFIIELLIRAERSGQKIVELPVVYTEAEGGHVDVAKQTADYLKNIKKLRRTLKHGI
ncbi:MAG: glycosyltransferase [Lachnospiraceae bacterium]|nr:glycosyltransferase [Lachnospiraceae bacterium]MDO4734289.1 glycosyltransferase [Lachnospiraceae bacterium]